jgi:hypothetical protein
MGLVRVAGAVELLVRLLHLIHRIRSRIDLGPEWHHLYPLYLGGNGRGPCIQLSDAAHTVFHERLASLIPGGSPCTEAQAWALFSDVQRRDCLTRAAAAAGIIVISEEWLAALDWAVQSATPGQPRPWRCGSRSWRRMLPTLDTCVESLPQSKV